MADWLPGLLHLVLEQDETRALAERLWTSVRALKERVRAIELRGERPTVQAVRGYGPRTGLPAPVVWVHDRLWVSGVEVQTTLDLTKLIRGIDGHWVNVPHLADLVQNLLEVLDQVSEQLLALERGEASDSYRESEAYLKNLVHAARGG